MYCTKAITNDITWVGADDRRLALFEGVYGVRDGVSYNSYLINDEKTVLFDTVDKAVSRTFFENLAHALNGRALDYLVISHMEPDHAATIDELCVRYPKVRIICNAMSRDMLGRFFSNGLTERCTVVKEGDSLSSGKHNFSFVMAPMVHWPEVMMTYDSTEKVLFSADAFGSFGALNGRIFADEVDFMHDWIDEARRYYTNIVGKYGSQVQTVLRKAATLEIDYVCPLHSFVWRRGFGDFLEKYMQWSAYKPEEKGVLIAYASVYGHTENTANILAGKLSDLGVTVKMYDTSVIPSSYILSDAFRYSHLVFAATTYNAGIFVTMEDLLHDIRNHNLQNRKVAFIENGSWAPTSGKLMREIIEPLKGTQVIGDTLTLRSSLRDDQLGELDVLAKLIADDIGASPIPKPVEKAVVEQLEVANEAFFKFSYGVEVVTTKVGGKDYGCVINTAAQVGSGSPKTVTISVIKNNYTCEMIGKAKRFNISVLTEEVPYALLKRFGFQSGREVDKFEGLDYDNRMTNGIRYIPEYTNAVFSCEVIGSFDVGSNMLFIANVTEAKELSKAPSCTYAYYHAHIKPKKAPAAPTKEGYLCKVCGYFYEESELPADFVCPLCKHGPDTFEHIAPPKVKMVKGFVCQICGYFQPYDGDKLPDAYLCPLCSHGPEFFTPAEQPAQ